MTQANTVPSPAEMTLEHFVFAPDRFESEKVPRRLTPEDVAGYVRKRITATTGAIPLEQAGKVIDYYDVYEVCEYLRRMLDRREMGPADLVKSAIIAGIIARSGTASDNDFAKLYYEYLAGRATTVEEYAALVDLVDCIGPGANVALLRRAMQKRLAAVEPQREKDFKLKLEYHKLQELQVRLDRAEKANAVKQRIVGTGERRKRIAEEVRTYLGLANGYPEFLVRWSARRLRRETWALQPPQQFVRADEPPLREEVARAFEQAMHEVSGIKDVTPAEREQWELVCLEAIDFFGGALKPAQGRMMREKARPRNELLSNY